MFVISAMLLAFLTICFKARKHREFALLAMEGVPKKQMLLPLLLAGGIVILGFCLIAEWGLPQLYRWGSSSQYISKSQIHSYRARQLSLDDGSSLIYRHYASTNQQLEDVFWIADSDHIWHFHALDLATNQGLHPRLAVHEQGVWSLVPAKAASITLPFTLGSNSLTEMIDPKCIPISGVMRYAWFPPANLPSHLVSSATSYLYQFLLPLPLGLFLISILAPLWLEIYPTRISFRKIFVTLGVFLSLFVLHTISVHILNASSISMLFVLVATYCSIYAWGIFSYATLK